MPRSTCKSVLHAKACRRCGRCATPLLLRLITANATTPSPRPANPRTSRLLMNPLPPSLPAVSDTDPTMPPADHHTLHVLMLQRRRLLDPAPTRTATCTCSSSRSAPSPSSASATPSDATDEQSHLISSISEARAHPSKPGAAVCGLSISRVVGPEACSQRRGSAVSVVAPGRE